jgi:hypothetical protein
MPYPRAGNRPRLKVPLAAKSRLSRSSRLGTHYPINPGSLTSGAILTTSSIIMVLHRGHAKPLIGRARGRFDNSKIDGLEERLNLAKDHHGYLLKTSDDVAKKLADAQAEIAKLKHQIEDRAAPEVLRGTIGSAEKYIADTATANNDLRRAIAGTITRVKVPR